VGPACDYEYHSRRSAINEETAKKEAARRNRSWTCEEGVSRYCRIFAAPVVSAGIEWPKAHNGNPRHRGRLLKNRADAPWRDRHFFGPRPLINGDDAAAYKAHSPVCGIANRPLRKIAGSRILGDAKTARCSCKQGEYCTYRNDKYLFLASTEAQREKDIGETKPNGEERYRVSTRATPHPPGRQENGG
jgi:hypothetical protein